MEILFGKKHPHEVLHEAFAQHLRDKGHAGAKIAVHTTATKRPLSGWDEDAPVPVHGKIAYEDHPKKMGFEPGSYSKENMPTMDSAKNRQQKALVPQGSPIWQDELRKYENLKDSIRKLIMAKLEARDVSEED